MFALPASGDVLVCVDVDKRRRGFVTVQINDDVESTDGVDIHDVVKEGLVKGHGFSRAAMSRKKWGSGPAYVKRPYL